MMCAASALLTVPLSGSDFQDTTYGYTVSSPEFAAAAPGGNILRLTVSAPPEAGFAANMGVMVQEVKTTREQYIALSEKQFAAAGMTIRGSSKRDVSGRPAVVFDYEGQMGGRGLHFLSMAVLLPDRVLLVTYTAPASAFGALEAEFRRSLDSFKLTGK